MEKQFVTYEIALKFKELGFDEPCFGLYKNKEFYRDYDTFQWSNFNDCIKAPLWQQALSFLLKKLDCQSQYYIVHVEIYMDGSGNWIYYLQDDGVEREIEFNNLEDGCLKAIKIIENECTVNYKNYRSRKI